MVRFAPDLLPTVVAALVVHQILRRDERLLLSRLFVLLLAVPACICLALGNKSQPFLLCLLKSFVRFFLTLASSIVLYRLSPWHPVARYPGPLLCKVTKIYWAIITRTGKQHKLLAALHEKYGEIVRIGPNEVSIANAAAIDPLMGAPGHPKGQFWEGRLPESIPVRNLVGMRDRKEHARRRRPWIRALNPAALKHYETFLVTRTNQMIELLTQKAPGLVDMTTWMGYYTFDVMNDLVFGEGPEMMKNGDQDNLWHLLEASQETLFIFGMVPWFGKLMLRVADYLPILHGIKQYRRYAFGRVTKRRLQGSPHKDLYYHLIDEGGVLEQRPTNAEIMSDSTLAIIAGADTTVTALTTSIYFMMRYPKVYRRIQREVDSLGNDLLNPQKQAQLNYLNAVLSETLRLWPPVLSGSQREVNTGTGGAMVGPYHLADGTAASIAIALVHKDPRNFAPYPETFIPERWLSEEQREELEPEIFSDRDAYRLNQNTFLAFSCGPANCIGRQLAWLEMRMVICLLVHHFDFKFPSDYNPQQYEDDFRDFYISSRGSLPTILTRRR